MTRRQGLGRQELGRQGSGRQGSGHQGLGWLWLPLGVVGAFLYVPIAALVFIVQQRQVRINFKGLSLRWYPELFRDPDIGHALLNSLLVGVSAMVMSTVLSDGRRRLWSASRGRPRSTRW